MSPPPLRVLTNTPWLDGRTLGGRAVTPVRADRARGWRAVARCLAVWRYDAALLNIDVRSLLLLCAAKKLLPFARCRILSADLVLTRPEAARGRMRFAVRRWLLGAVDRFVFYFRDTAELRRVYAIPPDRVRYVPFKVNTHDQVLRTETVDEGFFLACGRSNRDFTTLCGAFRGSPHRCVVLAPWGRVEEHGTREDAVDWPENVERVADDGTPASWNAWIARCRAVVLPIVPGMLSPSGISTLLVAMAMGKPVIITESAATRDVLDDTVAAIVPPADADALRAAVARVALDAAFRAEIGERGRRFALSLGGEERLRDDLVRELDDLLATPRGRALPAAAVAPAVPE
ncbi:MAG TPA: glycosyltransferase [Longimicrobium sp.]